MGRRCSRSLSPPCYEAIECALILFATRRELPELRRVPRTIDQPATARGLAGRHHTDDGGGLR